MKFSIWTPMQYAGDGLQQEWPAPGRLWEPERGTESARRAFALADRAVEAGFDMVSVSEHHYGYQSLVPSPTVVASMLAQRYPEITIGVLGPVLPLSNPVRVAEEIAMVDMLSGGRTIVGFFRGLASEQLVYWNNPDTTADMYREAFELILHAWTEPETFGWEGRNYRFRTVSAFPRPVQQPHPPILHNAATPGAARWSGSHGYMVGLYAPAIGGGAAEVAQAFRDARDEAGKPSAPEDILYRARVYVAETDEKAAEDIARYQIGNVRKNMVFAPQRAATSNKIRSALFAASAAASPSGTPAHVGAQPTMEHPDFSGSPETVARQLRESSAAIGWGLLDCMFTSPGMPFDLAERSVELFATEVMPAVIR